MEKYFKKLEKGSPWQPNYVASSVLEINFKELKKSGVKCVAFDIDGTLTKNGSNEIDKDLAEELNNLLDKAGIKKRYIASNSKRSLKKIATSLGSIEIHQPKNTKGKPSREYFEHLIKKSGCKPNEVAMIGDRILQDVWGANKSGLTTVLVALNPSYSTFRDKILLRHLWNPGFVSHKADTRFVFRNPVYVIYTFFSILLLLGAAYLSTLVVSDFETALFRSGNELPSWLFYLFSLFAFFGSIVFVILITVFSVVKRRYEAGFKFFVAGITAYFVSYGINLLELRNSSSIPLSDVNVRETVLNTYGFPSINVAIATALAIIAYQYVPKQYRRVITILVLLVALSQMYLGTHLPLDLIGGYAVGLAVGSAVCLVTGRKINARVTTDEVKQALIRMSFPVKTVKVLSVDARGSSPFMVTDKSDVNYFLKVVSKDNFFADWLFKMWRKVIYKRLEDEVPFLSPKRQIEHESYIANLAYANGIKTPRIVGVYQVKDDFWAQMQVAIDGKSLDKLEPSKITDGMINKVFGLVAELHKLGIIHRDLRSANIFVDKKLEPWLIDFGFGEASVRPEQTYRDIVELLCSMSTLVKPERVVKSAIKYLPKDELVNALPYIDLPSLSTETKSRLKKEKDVLPNLLSELKDNLDQREIKKVKIKRF
jgi:HAD superfamily phosphatase (TIGR01668 family)